MTAALEQEVETLEAPAPAFLASVSEPGAVRVLLIEDGAIDHGFLADELSKQGFAVRKIASLPAAAHDMPTSSSSIVTSLKVPASTCWASFAR